MRTLCLASLAVLVGCASSPIVAGDGGPNIDAGPLDAGSHPYSGANFDAGLVGVAPFTDGGPLGATLFDGGAHFRVWAPNAQQVSVTGDFGTQALSPLGDGTFVGSVAGAMPLQHYAFQIQSGSTTVTRSDPRATLIGADPGRTEPPSELFDPTSLSWSDAGFVAPPINQMVIYELHIATFENDGGNGGGTYTSAETGLPALKALGINMIELMPIAEFPGNYSWGYNPTYPFAPSRAYGSPEDLNAFVDQAHRLGIGVILDVVFNHFGLDSSSSPSLSMWCFDGPCDGGGIYFSPEPSTPFGPRPSFGMPEVHDLITDAIASWLANYHVDGFRWDSAVATRTTGLEGTSPHLESGARLLKDVNVLVHQANPRAITIAEDLQSWPNITEPIDSTQLDTYSSGYGFDAQWDDSFFYTIVPMLTSSDDGQRDVTKLASLLSGLAPMQNVVYTEDHDKVAPQNGASNQRIPVLIGLGNNEYWAMRRSGLGIAMVMTSPAVPMLFMGQEFLETLPFPFSPAPALNWSNAQTNAGFEMMVHDLIALRENTAGTTAGLTGNHLEMIDVTNTHNGATAPSIVFHRWSQGGPGDDVVVAANFSNTPLQFTIGFPAAGTWHVRFNSDDQRYSSAFTGTPSTDVTTSPTPLDGQAQSGRIQLGSYSVVILSQ